jgi:hypothetical protein
MRKVMMALLAGFMSVAVAGAYAAGKGDEKKSETGMEKSAKGMDKKDDKKGKGKGDKGEAAPK